MSIAVVIFNVHYNFCKAWRAHTACMYIILCLIITTTSKSNNVIGKKMVYTYELDNLDFVDNIPEFTKGHFNFDILIIM